ncbi:MULTISPECIES: hypothetical protein [unclassified Bradyrhizobium]|uniref:hypothetical protein n=1 Tax=unclassified Bradyrhizobium TaxID=2631580 RepID=UPI0028F0B14E|nr:MULTISPECIES: hypothetical protein [unclassified Bradyrhizobium]
MTSLTRRRDPQAPNETWRIYFGDVQAGTIAKRTEGPSGSPSWQWFCGFYPGSHPGEQTVGSARSYDQAREAFEASWRVFLSNRSPQDFDEWRKDHAFTAWKYAMWDAGCRLPTQTPSGRSRCFCGAVIDLTTTVVHIRASHMPSATTFDPGPRD